MNLVEMILGANNGNAVSDIAKQVGLSPAQTEQAIGELMPAFQRSMQRKESEGGLDSLLDLMEKQEQYNVLNEPKRAMGNNGVQSGNEILGALFGSKDVSRAVASNISATTGISSVVLKALLPIVANMVMGAMTSNSNNRRQKSSGGMLSILDFDGDGSSLDDLLNIAGRMMR